MTKPTYGQLTLVKQPIEIPGPLRSGLYRDVLVKASQLEPTSKEKKLVPHYAVPFPDAGATRKFLAGLGAARRRAKSNASDADLLNVRYMRVNDKSKGKFEVYVWNEPGRATRAHAKK